MSGDVAPVVPPDHPRRIRVPMRMKLLATFAGAYTLVFLFIAIWVVNYSTNAAISRLEDQLKATSIGAAATTNAAEFAELIANVPAVPDAANPTGLGYPESPLYRSLAQQLYRVREVVPEANPYSYFRDAADGKLYFAVSAGYLLDPPFGVTYRVPVSAIVTPDTYTRMERGLTETTAEPPYTDSYGSWISSYSPVEDAAGATIGAVGIDYPLTYVETVRKEVRRNVFPALLGSYLALLLLVIVLSAALVRPLRRLTEATARIADGEYDLDVQKLVNSRFPDEMVDLSESFEIMARKVAARERTLTKEVQRLKVEIDATKRQKAVEEITGTDFFADLSAKAALMRKRIRAEEGHDEEGSPDGTS